MFPYLIRAVMICFAPLLQILGQEDKSLRMRALNLYLGSDASVEDEVVRGLGQKLIGLRETVDIRDLGDYRASSMWRKISGRQSYSGVIVEAT